MAIVYKYTNKINGKSYVGQTVNPEQRKRSHKSSHTNPNDPNYDFKFYRALRKYGWENFSYEILEEVTDVHSIYERESFYIKELDSIENGYNLIDSVKGTPYWSDGMKMFFSDIARFRNSALDYDDVVKIRKAYLEGEMPSNVYEEYKEAFSHYYSFMNVWCGSRYAYVMPEVFDIRPNRVKLDYEKAEYIRYLYKNEGLTYKEIAQLYNIGASTVRDVITERTWKTKKPVSTIPS